MNLILTVYNSPAWKTFANASKVTLTSDPFTVKNQIAILEPVQSLLILPTLIAQLSSEQACLLAVEQAEHFLANAINNGNALELASKQWVELTTALLDLQRKHRKQLQLFNLQQALEHPKEFCSHIKNITTIEEYQPHQKNNNLALLAACQYVSQNPEIRSLNTRLQATVLALCETQEISIDINHILERTSSETAKSSETIKERDLILHHLQHAQEQLDDYSKSSLSQLSEISSERDQLILQLQQAQEQLEATVIQIATTATERDEAFQQLEQALTENQQLNITFHNEEQKNKHSVLAQEKQQAKEIAKLEKELRKVKARAANAEHANQTLKNELAKMKSSTLWKATEPVRLLSRIVKKSNKESEKLQQDIALLLTSEYFDINWYLKNYPDVADSKINPAEHYLLYGASEGRLPGPFFDGNWYSQHYPDVATAGANPLLHFIMFGQQEGRNSSPILLTNNSQGNEE